MSKELTKETNKQNFCKVDQPSWVDIPVSDKRLIKKKHTIKYPIFLECKEIEPSFVWKEIFANAALGKFPAGIVFKNDKLSMTQGQTIKVDNLPSDPQDVIELMRKYMRIRDKNNSKEQLSAKLTGANIKTVRDIMKPKLRSTYAHQFFEKEKEKYNLDYEEEKKFLSFITIELNRPDIKENDIVLADNGLEIMQMKNIEIVNNQVRWINIPKKTTIKYVMKPKGTWDISQKYKSKSISKEIERFTMGNSKKKKKETLITSVTDEIEI